jgi:uncharacterized protein (TIGR02588 family)
MSDGGPAGRGAKSGGQALLSGVSRRFAEWISLGISTVLLLCLAGYLLLQALAPDSPYLLDEARPLTAEVQQKGDRYILPIEISNQGRRTLRELKVEVRATEPGGKSDTRELQIDYLGEQSAQKVFLYFEQDPRGSRVETRPVYYLVD